MTLTQLRYIIALNECRNFVQAAEQCFVSQPTLSLQVKKLESTIGEAIWDRSQTPIVPTVFGEVFIQQSYAVLNEVEVLERLFHKESPDLEGHLTIGIIPTVASYLFIRLYQGLLKQFPSLELIIHELPTSQILDRLENGTLDVAILAGPIHNRHLQEKILYYEPFCVQLHQNAKIQGKSVSLQQMQTLPLLMLSEEHCLRGQTIKLCKHQDPKQTSGHLECTNIEIMKQLVNANIASAVLPLFCAKAQLLEPASNSGVPGNESMSQVVSFEDPAPARVISMVSRKNFYYARRLDAVEQMTLDIIPKDYHSRQGQKVIGVDQNV